MTLSRTLLTLAALGILAGAGLAAGLAAPPALRDHDRPDAPAPRTTTASHNNSSGNHTQPPPNGTRLPPPVVTPANQTVVAAYNRTARFQVVVTNPANASQNVSASASGQLGWTVRLDAFDGNLSPGESVTVTGGVSTLAPLPSRGDVTLTFRGRDASAWATVSVCFVSLLDTCAPNGTQPPRNDTRPPPKNETGNETKPPQNGTGGNQTRPPPKNETGGNETQPPKNETSAGAQSAGVGAPADTFVGLALREEGEARVETRHAGAPGGGGVVAAAALVRSPTFV